MSISGSKLACLINGVEINGLHQWEASDSGTDKLDATTGATGGYTNTDVGCYDLDVTLRLYFDLTAGITVVVYTGDVIENVELFRSASDVTPAFTLPEAIVVSSPETVEVRGKCEITMTIKNRGYYDQSRD